MVVKVYISGISGNKEVKKRQQRVVLILESKNVKYEIIDIAEPGSEDKKEFMQTKSTCNGGTISDPNPRHPLPPQIFNEEEYCGDYDKFDMANEIDEMEKFLKLAPDDSAPTQTTNAEIKLGNGDVIQETVEKEEETKEPSPVKDVEKNGTGENENKVLESEEAAEEKKDDEKAAEEPKEEAKTDDAAADEKEEGEEETAENDE